MPTLSGASLALSRVVGAIVCTHRGDGALKAVADSSDDTSAWTRWSASCMAFALCHRPAFS
jgi:hypothetical protein